MRIRLLVLTALVAGAVGTGAQAAPPPAAPKVVKEVVSVTRTAKTGQAVVALAGRVRADKVPGFFAVVDRYADGSALESLVDFGALSGATKYGHGSEAPLCDAPIACDVSRDGTSLKFSLAIADDAEDNGSQWLGRTRYFVLEGTGVEITHAEVGFAVQRKAHLAFDRVTADQADADGVAYDSTRAEVFKAAALTGGSRGSFAVAQLPCDVQGAGTMTFAATGDLVPSVITCSSTSHDVYVGASGSGIGGGSPGTSGVYTREASGATSWQLSGAVTGVTQTATRLFVLDY